MAFSRALDKVTIDRDWIERFLNALNGSEENLGRAKEIKKRDVDIVIDEMLADIRRNGGFDLDSYLAEEASMLHQHLEVDFNKKEAALIIYRRASERVEEKWRRIKESKVSSKYHDYDGDISEAQREIPPLKRHLMIIESIRNSFDLEDFRGYDLAHLEAIFDNLEGITYLEEDSPKMAAEKIIRKDRNYLEQLEETNEKVRGKVVEGSLENVLGALR